MDLYKQLSKMNMLDEFPWDKDYNTMMNYIIEYNNYHYIDDTYKFLQIFRCSLILYDRYKSNIHRNKYTTDELCYCVKGGFRGEGEYIFKKIRIDINTNNNKYNKDELFDLYCKYEYEFCDHDDNYL